MEMMEHAHQQLGHKKDFTLSMKFEHFLSFINTHF